MVTFQRLLLSAQREPGIRLAGLSKALFADSSLLASVHSANARLSVLLTANLQQGNFVLRSRLPLNIFFTPLNLL